MGEIEQNLDRHRPQIDSNINTVRPKKHTERNRNS